MRKTEVTVQVFDSFQDILNILTKQGFVIIDSFQINDWYFSKFEDVFNISYKELIKNSFLVREIIYKDKKEIEICYKDKIMDIYENVISEEKIKTFIKDLNILKIFLQSGLNNYAILKNNSYVFKKQKITFVLQVVDNLGVFIEYEEDESMKNLNEKQKINLLKNTLQSLNLKLGNDYSCKKVFMLLNKKNDS